MRENTVKKIWARGEAVVNGWRSIPSWFSAEVMAHQGFDSLTIDMRHGVVVAAGYQFVTLASDSRFMVAKAADEVAAVRQTGVKAGKLPAY